MKLSSPYAATLAFLLASAGVAGPARAESEAVDLRLLGDATCVDETTIVDLIHARTDRFRRASPGEGARRFRITIVAAAPTVTGTLEIDGSPPTRRTIHGATCTAVAAALATMVALAIDAPAPAPAPAPATPPAPAPSPESPPSSPPPLSLGLLALTLSAPGDGAGLGFGAFADLRWAGRGLFRPSVRLGAAAVTERTRFGIAGADWTFYIGRAELCPTRVALGAEVEVVACGAIDVGALLTTGEGISSPVSDTRVWGAAGVGARIVWRLAPRWETEATASLLAPFDSYRFYVIDPRTGDRAQVHEMAPLGVAVSLGLAYEPWSR